MQDLSKLHIGKEAECLSGDLRLEMHGHAHYVKAIACCESVHDFASRRYSAKDPQ